MTTPKLPPCFSLEVGVDAWGKHPEAVATGPAFVKHFRDHDRDAAIAQATAACWEEHGRLLRELLGAVAGKPEP